MNLYEVTLLMERESARELHTPTRITVQVLTYASSPVSAISLAQQHCAETLGGNGKAATYAEVHALAQYLRKSNQHDTNVDGARISAMALDYRPLDQLPEVQA